MSDLFNPSFTLTVSELNAAADDLLQTELAGYWVSGEISNLTRAASGHYYFALKDDQAQVRCALFKFAAARLTQPLKEGDHIEVLGKIGIYGARGEFQITVNEVRQMGLGRLFERYERLKARLQEQGFFDEERKRSLPAQPRAIGIVTSLAAAALRDVVSTLKRRAPHIPIIVYPTPVQGAGSEQQIAKAIQTAQQRQEVDVLIVCRGGGSIEDLWAFNEEAVVYAVAACTLPVVSGVGHETDFTLCDFVADVRAPTPTAAAELVSPNNAEHLRRLQHIRQVLQQHVWQHYRNAAQKTDWLAQRIQHPRQKLAEQNKTLQYLAQSIQQYGRQRCERQQHRLQQLAYNLAANRPNIAQQKQRSSQVQAALSAAIKQNLQDKIQRVMQYRQLMDATSPYSVLQRGYALVRDARGHVVRQAERLRLGQKVRVEFAEGQADMQVLPPQAQDDLFD